MISVAAVQHPSVYLNKDGCLERAVEVIKQAASENIDLLVFSRRMDTGISNVCLGHDSDQRCGRVRSAIPTALFEFNRSIQNQLAPVRKAAREYGVVVVMCINERAEN